MLPRRSRLDRISRPPLASSRTASFAFDSPRPSAQFQCRLDGGDFSPCASPQEFGNLPEGTHTFEVRAFDQYGNVDGSPAVYTWTVDVTAPGPQISNAGGETPSVQGRAGTSAGDADKARAAMRRHFSDGADRLVKHLDDLGIWREPQG